MSCALQGARTSPNGDDIYVLYPTDGAGNIWGFSTKTGQEWAVTNLENRTGALGAVTLASDGRYVYFTWEEDFSDIWVMDVVTDEDS
jgi:Tol biopolymer transport system component